MEDSGIWNCIFNFQFSSVQSLSRVWLFATPWIAARQASMSITNSWSSLKLMCIESVMPSSHLILCRPLLLLPPIPPSIRVFSNESTLRMRWPKYWSPLEWTGWISVQSKGLSRVFSNTTGMLSLTFSIWQQIPTYKIGIDFICNEKKILKDFALRVQD